MLFNFELFPIDDVAPWTTPSEGNAKSLGWFGLTQGWYWIDTGAGELFHYSDALVKHWSPDYPDVIGRPYTDYYVVRLWEDILQMLPAILEPLPNDIAAYIRPSGLWGSWAAWQAWSERGHDWMDTPEGQANWELFSEVSEWWWARKLDTAYLKESPGIWLWCEDDQVHIHWDNTDEFIDGLPAWSTKMGKASISVPDFLAEVQSFHQRLMQAMAERVDELRHNWSRPDVRLDWPQLREEHRLRTSQLSKALTRPPEPTDWDTLRTQLAAMERHLADDKSTDSPSETDAD